MKKYPFYLTAFLLLFLTHCKNAENTETETSIITDAALEPALPEDFQDATITEENSESYAEWTENPFESPVKAPLSTFSIDVDNASYTNIRRFINN